MRATFLPALLSSFLALVPSPKALPAPDSRDAALAFDRLKALDGTWVGRSTKGWTEGVSYRTIAAGSAVVETSLGAHPGEAMMTTIVLDGSRLLLAHYCVAKNQPRLIATAFEEGGRKITFTFLDGTNLPSRDTGHMDKVVFRFLDDNHFTTQWTWYQNGKEAWMEEIRMERRAGIEERHLSTTPPTPYP
jgi:hypothetical protein